MSKKHAYEGKGLTVTFEAARCIHAAECVHGLPDVFDPQARPWVAPDAAAPEALEKVIEACPTGALRYRRADGEDEAPDTEATFSVVADGPLHARGDLHLTLPDGSTERLTRLALCRCGASANKPFCDNSHDEAGFRDNGGLGAESAKPVEEETAPPVKLRLRPDGPVVVDGNCTVRSADGATTHQGGQVALCRCGASARKPYCDGSHKRNGFQAD